MWNVMNTKLILLILAALTILGSAVAYQRYESTKAAAAAARAAAILEQQRKSAAEQREHEEALRKGVEKARRAHNSAAANEGKTWRTYIP